MSEVPGVDHIRANYEVVKVIDNETELELTTGASLSISTSFKLAQLGWVQRAHNVVAFLKPQTVNLVMGGVDTKKDKPLKQKET